MRRAAEERGSRGPDTFAGTIFVISHEVLASWRITAGDAILAELPRQSGNRAPVGDAPQFRRSISIIRDEQCPGRTEIQAAKSTAEADAGPIGAATQFGRVAGLVDGKEESRAQIRAESDITMMIIYECRRIAVGGTMHFPR